MQLLLLGTLGNSEEEGGAASAIHHGHTDTFEYWRAARGSQTPSFLFPLLPSTSRRPWRLAEAVHRKTHPCL